MNYFTGPRVLPRVARRTAPGNRPAVLQVALSLAPGGTERLVIQIAQRLASRFEMTVCCLDTPGDWAAELTAVGIPVVALHRSAGFRPSLGMRIARLARQRGASILHCHHYSPFIYGRIAALLSPGTRVVFTEHGRLSDAPPSPKRRIANTALSRLPGPIYAVSEGLKRHMVAEGFPAHRVGVIHNGIELLPAPTPGDRAAARHALGIADDAFVIGTAARLDPVKNLDTLIAALQQIRDRVPNAEVLIIGDGPERQRLEAAAAARGLGAAVRMVGYRSDVRALLPACDAYVNCSVTEGVSLTILEAMSTALPVVATAVGGTPEIIRDGVTGHLIEPNEPDAIARAVIGLAHSPHRRAAVGAAARTSVEESFTLDRMVNRYADEYLKQESR